MNYLSLIQSTHVDIDHEKKVIPAKLFTRLLKAEDLIKEVKKECKALEKETTKICEERKEEATREGFKNGMDQWNEQSLLLEKTIQTLRHEMMEKMLPLTLQVIKKIIGKELQLHPETVVDIIMQVLKPVEQRHQIKIYVSKADKELVEKDKSRIKTMLKEVEVFSIEEKEDLAEGSCVIETESGIINATLEDQWNSLEAAFNTFKNS